MILWSLAVEEQFYILWPFLVHYLTEKWLFCFSLIIISLSPLARALVYSAYGYPGVYVLTICRLDALASGAMLALLFSNESLKDRTIICCKKLAPLALVAVLATFIAPFGPSFPQTRPLMFTLFGYTWIAIALAILVGASIRCEGWTWSVLSSSMLMFVGKRCYGFYLWHAVTAVSVKKVVDLLSLDVGFYGQLSVWVFCLIVVASVSWSFIEQPFLGLKRLVPYPVDSGGCRVSPSSSMVSSPFSS